MAEYPYCTVPGRLGSFLGKIRQMGVPDKVNTRWLPTIGFGSKNDRSIVRVLGFVGLIDSDGRPTDVWRDFRGPEGPQVLGRAIESSYTDLFNTYPDAHNRTADELRAFIRGHSSYGAQGVEKAERTFRALCQHAEFTTASRGAAAASAEPKAEAEGVEPESLPGEPSLPSLHIDIQVHISPEASVEQIEKVFESMAAHLYKRR